MPKWADRWAVVTGASSGIGAEFARQLAARGMHLVLTARREDRLNALAEELDRLHGAKSIVICEDLSQADAAARLYSSVVEYDIDVAVLVNNAGFGQVSSLDDHELPRDLSMIDLNIRSLTELTYRFLTPMREKGEGTIINVASIAGFQPVAYMPTYAASKAYVLHFSESLWAELKGTDIRITALCPGTTETEFFDEAGVPGWLQKQSSKTPEKVVKIGLRGVEKRKSVVVTGKKNWFVSNLSRFFPRKLVVLESRKYFRPRQDS